MRSGTRTFRNKQVSALKDNTPDSRPKHLMIPLLRIWDTDKGISERLALQYALRSEVLGSAIYSLDTID